MLHLEIYIPFWIHLCSTKRQTCFKEANIKTKNILSFFSILILLNLIGRAITTDDNLDVTGYYLTIKPEISESYITGSGIIKFKIKSDADSVIFNSGKLEINKVKGSNVLGFKKVGKNLIVYLSKRDGLKNEIVVDYQGKPPRGLIFDEKSDQVYTYYFTSDWMICNDSPEDKAIFHIDITIPKDKACIASGELVNKIQKDDKVIYFYELNTESPSYTYGFAFGKYIVVEEKINDISLKYYSLNYNSEETRTIFRETPAMISFFQEKTGVKYFQSAYSQVLAGNYFQEMSGFSLMKEKYGKIILQDSTDINLISHEMAHQWWGNQITCKGWNHFWLNEGMATFMSAAYNEHRFGKEVYLSNIESYYEEYKGILGRGNDRSLVFEDWTNPSNDDRNLVYVKGAYVIHLLKEKLGDEVFWNAIRFYSKKYFGKTVETIDFQRAFEESSGVSLDDFFNEWVYKTI